MIMNKKECELCNSPATMYCESDRASLCWKCDSKIHSANFLVAKHVRSLLCHICRCPTPWKASGAKLGSTLTACRSCVSNKYKQRHDQTESAGESQGGNEDEDEVESDENNTTSTTDEDDDDDDDDDEEIDNQVVPMSSSIALQPVSSSSNSQVEETLKFPILLKRLRNPHEDDLTCSASSSSSYSQPSEEDISLTLGRPFKVQKREETLLSAAVNDSGSDFLLNSLRKFHQQITSSNNLDLGISIHTTHPVAG